MTDKEVIELITAYARQREEIKYLRELVKKLSTSNGVDKNES